MTALTRIETLPASVTQDQIWANLRKHAQEARGAFTRNTERAMRADVKGFTAWCSQEGRQAIPASPDTIADFVDAMAASKAPATVTRYVASIAAFHRAAEVVNPCQAQAVRFALRRMRRELGSEQQQAAPINHELVREMLKAASRNTLRNLRDKAVLVVAYTTLARRSELCALQLADLQVEADGFGTVVIRRSKGDQEGHGAVAPITPDAMRHLQAWIEAAKITDGPLFRAIRKGPRVQPWAMGANDVALAFKDMGRRARLSDAEIARISAHSTRIGAAQDMTRFDQQLPGIMQAGRWKSPAMVGRYTAKLSARDGAAVRIAHKRTQF